MEHFMRFVVQDEQTGCWLWSGGKTPKGYGHYYTPNGKHSGGSAHRASYKLFKGEIPDGQIIRHKCRNKCVNPEHLELGTYKDNANDRERDGVSYKGIKNPACKYTEDQIRDIRRRYAEGETQTSIAKSLGIRQGHISDICLRKVWSHI
jgi:hypothetical protein